MLLITFIVSICVSWALTQGIPTNYEYYTNAGIQSGLSAKQPYFTLNGLNMSVYSGAMHYFRVPRSYWRDRLRKMRAAGLNTVESYIPWNLHEYQSGVYDFGDGGSEMEDFLHITEFLKTAQEEDLFVILRTGPYICAEYNFGGFPSWLLREENIAFRTSDPVYMKYVTRYLNVLLTHVQEYQFTKGGPIIMFQVENEYGNQEYGDFLPDKTYLEQLYQIFHRNSIVELLVTSDSALSHQDKGTIPQFLQTVNLGASPEKQFEKLEELQPGKPYMSMEYWIGWFDYWSEKHNSKSADDTRKFYERILKYPASVNIYMFHGGTNFYFLNGASLGNAYLDNSGFKPITTSYDYDAPLTEWGNYTEKYSIVKELLAKYNPIKTFTPDLPQIIEPIAYPYIKVDSMIHLKDIIDNYPPNIIQSKIPIAMEKLPINNNSGQSYGYVVYRKENVDINAGSILTIQGHVCDTVMVLLNGVLVSPHLNTVDDLNGFGFWRVKDSQLLLSKVEQKNATLDLVVEEWGRMNGGKITQYNNTFKGIWQGDVLIDNNVLLDWQIIPLEFKKGWTNSLNSWKPFNNEYNGPALYRGTLKVEELNDTFIDMRKWKKGLVIVNGFVVGRHAIIGPQQSLYIPAPFLIKGDNIIIVFEHFKSSTQMEFVSDLLFE